MSDLAESPPATPPADAEPEWSRLIPDDQWAMLTEAGDALDRIGVPYLLGGALALATHTLHWRNTKDIDIIVQAADAPRAVEVLQAHGFADYFDRESYDRSWIYRGFKDGVLFDVIWDLPNHRITVDAAWFERATNVTLRARTFRSTPPEELVRMKLYVFQRERCDWVDVLNVLATSVERISWPFLVERMGRDLPLLHAVLTIFNWLCPGRAHALPAWLRKQFALPRVDTENLSATEARRVRLLDSRPWFVPHEPSGQPLPR